jgi:flagellar hook-associated protein 2
MSTITFGGLATGLDTGAIVNQLLAIRRQPITRLEKRRSLFEGQQSALADLTAKLEALEAAAADLDTTGEFGALTARSSHDTRVTATATGQAAPATYTITVNSLAAAQKDISEGFDSETAVVGAGTVTITVGGEPTEIAIESGDGTLTGLRDAINAAGAGVTATLMNDGSGTTPYRLVLTATDTGTAAAFSVDFSGLSGGTVPVMSNVTAAADASLVIDTVEVTSSSNSVASAVTGMTFELLQADPRTSVTVTVESDPDAIAEKIQALVDAYNDLFSTLETQGGEDGTLRGHPALRSVADRITALFSYPLEGSESDLTMLAQVGLTQGEGRQLVFSADTFQEALAVDFAAVRDLFVGSADQPGKAALISTAIQDLTDPVEGLIHISDDALDVRIEQIDDTIDRYERGLDTYRATLERRFAAMELMVSTLQAQGSFLVSQFGS